MEKFYVPGMWDYLGDMEKMLVDLPIFIDDPFTDEQINRMVSIFEEHKKRASEINYSQVPGMAMLGQEELRGEGWYDPKKVYHMGRELIEFKAPEDIEKTMDDIIKPLYDGELRLAHYQYIDYNLVHGGGKYAPALPVHIDSSEDIMTFNYMLDGNIDWELYIDNKPYQLRKGQAVVFSALNQPHFRPKRHWKEGEFVKIVSFDYSPLHDFRFTGGEYVIDPEQYPERMVEYIKKVNEHPKMQAAWELYNRLGAEAGIPDDVHGTF